MPATPKPGSIVWQDLTVPDATGLREFYSAVVGWTAKPHNVGTYTDYEMQVEGETVAGLCHAQGSNSKLPPCWLMYIEVTDVPGTVAKALAAGGTVIDGPRSMGGGHFAALKDPAGAVFAIFSPA